MRTSLSDAVAPARPKRRWLRFTLRTLLVAVTLVGIWLAVTVNAARRQASAVAMILRSGGKVIFDYQIVRSIGADGFCSANLETSPPAPEWLRRLVGDD